MYDICSLLFLCIANIECLYERVIIIKIVFRTHITSLIKNYLFINIIIKDIYFDFDMAITIIFTSIFQIEIFKNFKF